MSENDIYIAEAMDGMSLKADLGSTTHQPDAVLWKTPVKSRRKLYYEQGQAMEIDNYSLKQILEGCDRGDAKCHEQYHWVYALLNDKQKQMIKIPNSNRSAKGLKALAHKVRELVKREGPISYQWVAGWLVSIMRDTECDDLEWDDKNIWWRAYDAINVLVAVNVLWWTRDKLVEYDPSDPTTNHHDHQKQHWDELWAKLEVHWERVE